MSHPDQFELLSGWGGTPISAGRVVRPDDRDDLVKAGLDAGPRGVIPRGLGRAYGDAAMNAGGLVVDATKVSGVLDLDPRTGLVRALAGTSLDDLMRVSVPQGWFPPVTPGTRFVTIGGAIASDVHGKDHHAAGTFGAHVHSLVMASPDGTIANFTPDSSPEEFWATCGGMGLTGTILEATLALRPIETTRITVDTDRARDLEALLQLLSDGDGRYRYSVAWMDLLARGRNLGRAVLTRGDFATRDQLTDKQASDPLSFDPPHQIPSPPAPSGLVNRWTMRTFNELWFRRYPKQRRGELQSISSFFYPLDLLDGWPRLYGRRGFLQWQCLVPFGQENLLREVIESIADQRSASFLAVLKRLGPSNNSPLSFPAPGWTLALDMPVGDPSLGALLHGLDRQVAEAGGRVYLAKDSSLHPELVPVMYPRLDEWRSVRDRLDPKRRMISDLARRLHLFG